MAKDIIFLSIYIIAGMLTALYAIFLAPKSKNSKNLECPTKNYELLYIEGLQGLQNCKSKIRLSNNKILYLDIWPSCYESRKKSYNIKYENIKKVELLKQIEEKDKSVIGRAIVGGVLLGPVGAVVGGMSGLGTKQKKDFYLKITTNSQELFFKTLNGAEFDLGKCYLELKKVVNQPVQEYYPEGEIL